MSPSENSEVPSDRGNPKSDVSGDVAADILKALDHAHELALERIAQNTRWNINERFKKALDQMSTNSASASTGFTNIVTCLAIKVARPELDVRVHQVQIGAPFNFRGYSEKVIYPWLSRLGFNGAKSGWQTRTFERPKPYRMDFDENIGKIKESFLICFDEIQEKESSAIEGLSYLICAQIEILERKVEILANIQMKDDDDIVTIVEFFSRHFKHTYQNKGASRLPVLAIYAVYTLITAQINRYSDTVLQPLQRHSAADTRTGALGDIEIARRDGSIFEAFEIKHNIQINDMLVQDTARKVVGGNLDRYYILTTHTNCKPDSAILAQLKEIRAKTGCQIIVNGVLPTLQYYLRLLSEPALILSAYTELLGTEQAIDNEHRIVWAKILESSAASKLAGTDPTD